MKETTSLCPVCYAEIPAEIHNLSGAAWMLKACPLHGPFEAMVERDYRWWLWCQQQEDKGIYDGYFVDITSRCNLKCKYCFHGLEGKDRTIADVCQEVAGRVDKTGAVSLIGGEPTIHKDFFAMCEEVKKECGAISIVTNGTKTADMDFFKRTAALMMLSDDCADIHVSIHPESNGADLQTLANARECGIKINSILCVIDDVSQVKDAVALYQEYSDIVCALRIKNACNAWAEDGAGERVFVSDMLLALDRLGKVEFTGSTKTSFTEVRVNGLNIMPVSWYGTDNVDLQDIACAPWYRAKDGKAYNLLHALLVNEGMDKL
ncbi:MAG: radical SAM protein [Desulfuromonadaceae bacterium]